MEVCVSDAIFALDKEGRVHVIYLSPFKTYGDVLQWENVVHICVGNQCSVFGITKEGKILCAGYNCVQGPYGDLRKVLSGFENVVDVCAMGSECERVLLALTDGRVVDHRGNELAIRHRSVLPVFCSNYGLTCVYCEDEAVEFIPYSDSGEHLKPLKNKKLKSVAVGQGREFPPFAVGIYEKDSLSSWFSFFRE